MRAGKATGTNHFPQTMSNDREERMESMWRFYRWELLQRALRGEVPLPSDKIISEKCGANAGWMNKFAHRTLNKCKTEKLLTEMR